MLQIIGWLLCVYLVVKGFELVAMKHTSAYIGATIAFVAAPIFFVLINVQSSSTSPTTEQFGVTSGLIDPALDAQAQAMTEAEADALENQAAALESSGE